MGPKIVQVWAIWPFTIDDMFISLRYAKHWAEGNGLTWNIAEEPVEGYSNFSFVGLATLAIYLHLDPVIVLKNIGILGLFLSTAAIYCISRLWFSAWIAFIPCLWMLVYSGQIIWSVSGLETTIYQALIAFSLFFLFRGMGYCCYPHKRKKTNWFFFIIAGFLFALSGMTRPEAPVLMLLFYGLAFFDKPQVVQDNYYYQGLLLSCFILCLFYVPYFFWRWHYYGQLFPNAVYCKGFTDFSALELDKNYLRLAWPFLLLALPAIYWSADKRYFFLWLPSVLYLGLLVGADPVVAFANRLFLPVFILLLPLALQGIVCLINRFLYVKDRFYYISLWVSAVLVAFFFIPSMSLADYRYFTRNPQAGLYLRQKVVNWLGNNIASGSQVLLADSGMIPFLSSLHFIDSYCLNNKKMTQAPRKEMYQRLCNEVFESKPEVIILTSLIENGRVIYTPTDVCLSNRLKTNKMYQYRISYQTSNKQSSYRYEIYTLLN